MRTAAIATLALMLGATPAAAQIWGGPSGNADGRGRSIAESRLPPPERTSNFTPGVGRDLRQVNEAIRDGRRSGQLSRREARGLRRESSRIGGLQDRYARGGLSDSEIAALRTQVEGLRGRVVAKRSN